MILKTLEIRDSGTHIPALAIKMSQDDPTQCYQLNRVGFRSHENAAVILMRLNDQEAHSDPYDWVKTSGRTMGQAHVWIEKHWDELKNGDVVDVEFIMGITDKPKVSERFNCPICFKRPAATPGGWCEVCMGLGESDGEPAS